ncbi:MAG: S8 family serine peptidase [Bacteroidetes bacterium]|nr:S8 family serine peptidase [Bacteroidota bacterium]
MRQLSVRPVLPLPVRMQADVSSRGNGVCIAMIDSDFVQHPDLLQPTNRIVQYYDAVMDMTSDLPPVVPSSRHWHGTMTACTAAGNGYLSQGEFTSLAPNATVVLIRTMNEHGRVLTDVIVRALEYVRKQAATFGIRVVNLSVYADELDQSLDHPVTRLVEDLVHEGIVIVAASGNNPFVPIRPPASAPNAITVGGLDDKNTLDSNDEDLYHSTFGITELGVQKPDLIAPAISLPAPILPDTAVHREAAALCAMDSMDDVMLKDCAPHLLQFTKLGLAASERDDVEALRIAIDKRLQDELIASPYYKMVDGTSFAAPIVTSIVAQMLEAAPDLTPAEVKDILTRTAKLLSQHPRLRQGHGVVQQAAAVRAAREEFSAMLRA